MSFWRKLQVFLVRSKMRKKPLYQAGGSATFYPFQAIYFVAVPPDRRLTRRAKIHETLFRLLTGQYEMAGIQEAKDRSRIQVLDLGIGQRNILSERKHSS